MPSGRVKNETSLSSFNNKVDIICDDLEICTVSLTKILVQQLEDHGKCMKIN